MSLVSIVFGRNFISAVSDGRGSSDNKIIDENVKKIRKINSRTLIAFTGAFAIIERNGRQHYLYEDIIELAVVCFKKNRVKKAMKLFDTYIKEHWPIDDFGSFQVVIVSLVENDNCDTLWLTTNNNPKEKSYIHKIKSDKPLGHVILTHQADDKAKGISATFIENLEKSILPDLSNVVEVSQNEQVKLNHQVSIYDDSVNDNVYKIVLQRN
ncbi:hypothetical protein [Leuconostoc sp.]|uniref:hypothetical protein n=1 Tax=Leuconostoc sp. TaxID=1930076 RepID=UPI00295869A8|nr:hypothetical protein [Leuconostoc sp.]MDV8935937.1 hypothetical protein [Leuconostoc sp.]